MLCLNAGDSIAGVASVASKLTCTISGLELASGVETYKVLYQGQLPNAAASLYTTSGVMGFTLSIHVVNTDTTQRTLQLFINGLVAANAITPAIWLQPGGWALYTDQGWMIFNGSGLVAMAGMCGSLQKVSYITNGGPNYFTPGIGTRVLLIEAVGGGGGGGGNTDGSTNSAAAGGGGSGAYSAVLTTVMQSYAVAVGAGGPGGAAGANGTVGGDTTFGAILTAKGGSGGIQDTVAAIHVGGLGGAGGLASAGVGDIKEDGRAGGHGINLAAAQAVGGRGGNSKWGGGANSQKIEAAGFSAVNYGAGGAGAVELSGATARAGGSGSPGLLRIWEFG